MPSLASSSNRVIEPALFAARFWRDFFGSMLTHTVRAAMTKLLVLAAGILLVPHARAATNSHLDLVVALDLTKSVAVKGPDGTTEFQKNVDGVTRLLVEVPAGARVSIIGITDHSFTQPYFLLSATVPDDPGYFGERLGAARNEIVRVWKLRSARLQPSFAATDILGVLMLASQIFNQQRSSGAQRTLVIFSDMRNHTRELDLESSSVASPLRKSNKTLAAVDLHQVQVYALGVDGAGQGTANWRALELFWRGYLQASGASLYTFSVLRELPASARP